MSLFAYIAVELADEAARDRLLSLLRDESLAPSRQHFAEQYGARALYGFEPSRTSLFEVELSPELDLESVLLDLPDDMRWSHYKECSHHLGRPVQSTGEDDQVNEEYLKRPLELPIVKLLRRVAREIKERPIVLVLDPEFSARFGEVTELRGFEAITAGTWRAAALRDLDQPLRLVIT